MTTPTILMATDLSERSSLALNHAANQAKIAGATLIIVHVDSVPASDEGEGMLYHGVGHESEATLERRLESMRSSVDGGNVEHRLLKGDPVSEIVRVATEEDVAMIVMSTHGRTGLLRLILGSVAEQVLRRAPCPVLMVRPTPDPA